MRILILPKYVYIVSSFNNIPDLSSNDLWSTELSDFIQLIRRKKIFKLTVLNLELFSFNKISVILGYISSNCARN